MTDVEQARKSICIRCYHMSIWCVEFHNKICELSNVPVDAVLRGVIDECPNFKGFKLVKFTPEKLGPWNPRPASARARVAEESSKRQYVSTRKKGVRRQRKADPRPIDPLNEEWK